MFIFETHLHTFPCSACAKDRNLAFVDRAAELGLSGLVITNHFYCGNTGIDRALPWADFVNAYVEDYRIARAYGEEKGVAVLFGLEDGFGGGKEMLVYGLPPEAVQEHPELKTLPPAEKAALFRSLGGFVVCAHPFRHRSYIPEPVVAPDTAYFDGMEVENACNAPEENRQAAVLCQQSGLRPTAGSDAHRTDGLGKAGVAFYDRVTDSREFVQALTEGQYTLYIKEEQNS